jgi:hypothetical protein
MPDTDANNVSANEAQRATTKTDYAKPIIGCVTGGCLAPFLLFLFCSLVLRDTGGPLFWPIIAVPLGLIGLGIGLTSRSRQPHSDSMSADTTPVDSDRK